MGVAHGYRTGSDSSLQRPQNCLDQIQCTSSVKFVLLRCQMLFDVRVNIFWQLCYTNCWHKQQGVIFGDCQVRVKPNSSECHSKSSVHWLTWHPRPYYLGFGLDSERRWDTSLLLWRKIEQLKLLVDEAQAAVTDKTRLLEEAQKKLDKLEVGDLCGSMWRAGGCGWDGMRIAEEIWQEVKPHPVRIWGMQSVFGLRLFCESNSFPNLTWQLICSY